MSLGESESKYAPFQSDHIFARDAYRLLGLPSTQLTIVSVEATGEGQHRDLGKRAVLVELWRRIAVSRRCIAGLRVF